MLYTAPMRPGVYVKLFLLLGIAIGVVTAGCEDEDFSPVAQQDEDAAVESDSGEDDNDGGDDDASANDDAAPDEEDAAPDARVADAGKG